MEARSIATVPLRSLISFDLADVEALSSRIIAYAGASLALAAEVSDDLPVRATFDTDMKYRDRVGE